MLSIALASLLLGAGDAAGRRPPGPVTYEAYAVRFGILPAFSVARLVAGAERGRTLDIPVMVWLLKGSNGRQVLVDAGFHRQKFLDQWKPRDFRTPAAAVEAAGVKPEAITDIIISHAHWDHVDGVDLFPKATVWIQREEYRYYTGEAWFTRGTRTAAWTPRTCRRSSRSTPKDGCGSWRGTTRRLFRASAATPAASTPSPRSTSAPAFAALPLRRGRRRPPAAPRCSRPTTSTCTRTSRSARPIAQTLDAASNLKAQDRIRTLASEPRLIVPGHDPLVFERFERIADGIVRIK